MRGLRLWWGATHRRVTWMVRMCRLRGALQSHLAVGPGALLCSNKSQVRQMFIAPGPSHAVVMQS